jgi:hypothetical protein
MSLTTLWDGNREQIEEKHVWQVIAFAGEGKLRDESLAAKEFREFLSRIPSKILKQYTTECLGEKFDDSGFVLQDIVNQLGRRLGFSVTDGRYRGIRNQVGFDGIWKFPNGHVVIVEVKTTDVYQINLETIATYRREIMSVGLASDEKSSILIVIGREDKDTASLEAQIRGSRYAWNIRIISVEALVRLMTLKETVDDPKIISRISDLLIPKEFTKLDEIINLVFSTAEDVKEDDLSELKEDEKDETKEKSKPVSYYEECVTRIEKQLNISLLKQSKTTYLTQHKTTRISCAISKEYHRSLIYYWYAFHPHQKEFLEDTPNSYVSFGCGNATNVLLIPFQEFISWLNLLNITEDENKFYWHVLISREGNEFFLYPKKGFTKIDITKYLLRN